MTRSRWLWINRGARVGQVLLGIENVDRGALSSGGLAPHPLESDAGCAHFGLATVSATLVPSLLTHALTTAVRVWFRTCSSTMRLCDVSSLACRVCEAAVPPS